MVPPTLQGRLVAIDLGLDGAPARTSSEVRAPDARRAAHAWRVFAVLLLLTATLRLPAFFVDVFNSDETYLATQGEVIKDGGRLYEDAADRKPPAVPYLYAAAFTLFGTTALWSVRVLAMLAVAATALLLALEARRRWGDRAGWLAGLLFVLASVAFAPQDGQAANFEIFMLPAMTAAVLLAARGRAGSSGVAVALATLAKQTGAATLLPIAYLVWHLRGRRGVRDAAVGFAIPIALVALLVGPGDLLFWGVLGNGSYFGLGAASAYVLGMFLVMTLAFVACNLPIVWALPRAWRDRRAGAETDLWLWLLSAALSVAVGFRFFGHYYLQLLPPLCLLTAGALSRGRSKRAVQATVALAVAVAVGFSLLGFWVRPWGDEPRYQTVSRYLDAHTSPVDRVFVWGHMPEIYWASGKLPGTRFPTNGFLTGNFGGRPAGDTSADVPTPGAWQMFMTDLRSHPPRFILDTTPAAFRGSQYYPMAKFPELSGYVDRYYRYRRTIDGIDVYEIRPLRQAVGRR